MITIKVGGTPLYIPKDTTLVLEQHNNSFDIDNITSDVIWTFDLPAKPNARALNQAHYINISNHKRYRCEISFAGVVVSNGYLFVQSVVDEKTISCGVVLDGLGEEFGNRKLKENDYGDDVVISQPTDSLEQHRTNWYNFLTGSLNANSIYKFFLFCCEKFYKNNTKADELNEPIIYAPDHLLVTVQEVEIPEFSGVSQTITISSQVKTIVDNYIFEVHTVVGAEYIESAEAFVTNQASSSFFGRGEVNPTPATICFPVGVDKEKGCLYTVFNTFGKLPGESDAFLHILVRDTGGNEYEFSTDITDQFEKPDNHIIIEEPVDIPEPESSAGGIAPTVENWNEENVDVPIG